jgi:hypothetical protein
MTHPCAASRHPLKGAALAARRSRIGGALRCGGQGVCPRPIRQRTTD